MAYAPHPNERRSEGVSNGELWTELRYIRNKVDGLEVRILTLFGTVSAIAIAISIFEVMRGG